MYYIKKNEDTIIKKEQVVKTHINLDSIRHLICNKNWRSDYLFEPPKIINLLDSSELDISIEGNSKDKNINQLSSKERKSLISYFCDTDSVYFKSTYKMLSDYEAIIYDSPVINKRDTWKITEINSKIYLNYGKMQDLKEIVFLNEETLTIVPSSTDGFRVYTNDSIPYHESEIEKEEYFIILFMEKYYKERGFNLVKMGLGSTGK